MVRALATAAVVMLGALAGCGNDSTGTAAPADKQVVVRTDPATAAECPSGGAVVLSGLDDNQNGALDDAEVRTRTMLCRDAPVTTPAAALTRLVAEPAGPHCASGGTAVQAGLDTNGNATLDPAEVTHIDYVCDHPLVTRMASEPAGVHCVAGGIAFLVGIDGDNDGTLDDAEVDLTQTAYECGTTLSRDVAIKVATDASVLAQIHVINGSLLVQNATLQDLALPALEHVDGDFVVTGAQALIRVSAPQLRTVTGQLELAATDRLATLELPALHHVGGLTVTSNAVLHDLTGLAALTAVDGDAMLASNAALVSAHLSALVVGRDYTISSNPLLTDLAWSFSSRQRNVVIQANGLETLHNTLGTDASVASLELVNNPHLTSTDLTLGSVGKVHVEGNAVLDTFRASLTTLFPLTAVTGDVLIQNNAVLRGVEFLTGSTLFGLMVGGSLTITDPIEFVTFGSFVPQISTGGDCTIAGSSLQTLLVFHVAGTLHLLHNPLLGDLALNQIDRGIEIVDDDALVTLGSAGTLVGPAASSVTIADNAALTDLAGLAATTKLFGTLEISGNPALTAIAAPTLASAAQITIHDNASAHRLALPALTTNTSISVVNNPRLPACDVLAVFARLTTGSHIQSGNDPTAPCSP